MKKASIFLIFIVISGNFIFSTENYYEGTYFERAHLTTIPPLTTDMPYDVLIGYIALDSVRKHALLDDYRAFLNRQTYNDSIRTMLKHYYKIVDWVPMRFEAYKKTDDYSTLDLSTIEEEFWNKYTMLTPSTGDCLVATSYFIYHINIIDTSRFIDTTSQIYSRGLKCYCEILDILKGKVVNSFCSTNSNSQED